jgi:ABC-2 type transport system ATP-binding protein
VAFAVADDAPSGAGRAAGLDEHAVRSLVGVRGIRRTDAGDNGRVDWELRVTEPHRAIPALLAELARQQLELVELRTHSATLEDVFVALTGRQLRDG